MSFLGSITTLYSDDVFSTYIGLLVAYFPCRGDLRVCIGELVALTHTEDLDEVRWEKTLRNEYSCRKNTRIFGHLSRVTGHFLQD